MAKIAVSSNNLAHLRFLYLTLFLSSVSKGKYFCKRCMRDFAQAQLALLKRYGRKRRVPVLCLFISTVMEEFGRVLLQRLEVRLLVL